MAKKLKGRALSKFEAGRDVWQEVLDGVREIKSGGAKRHDLGMSRSFHSDTAYDMEKAAGGTQLR